MFSFGSGREKTPFKENGENFIFYPYGSMRKGILVSANQKEEIEIIFVKHFSPPKIYRIIRIVVVGGILIVNMFIGLGLITDFVIPVHFNVIILLACVSVLVAVATRPYRKELNRITKGMPRIETRMQMTEWMARDAATMSSMRLLLFSFSSGTIAAALVYYYFRSAIQIGMLDSLIYLMLFGLFAGLSSYYVTVWVKKLTGSPGGWP
jgi:hypothetical protein